MTRGGRNHSFLYSKKFSSFCDNLDAHRPYATSHTIRRFGNGSACEHKRGPCGRVLMSWRRQSVTVSKHTTYGMLLTVAGVRRDYRKTKKISWSIKESVLLTSQSVHPGRRDGRSSPINIYLKACIMEMDGMDGVPSYTIIQSFNITLLRTLFRVFKPF